MVPLRFDRQLTPRTPVSRGPSAAGSPSDLTPEEREKIAAQHATFDFQLAEQAELFREREALETLRMDQLKNEDEIMKKWIALI
ncbi:MAG: hypothetical protein JO092_10215 [Candidatus Eremiobacteraeota bacterium]|nr:hypothetical protein [Candidatus Eremiobacteraeota bacterium]